MSGDLSRRVDRLITHAADATHTQMATPEQARAALAIATLDALTRTYGPDETQILLVTAFPDWANATYVERTAAITHLWQVDAEARRWLLQALRGRAAEGVTMNTEPRQPA